MWHTVLAYGKQIPNFTRYYCIYHQKTAINSHLKLKLLLFCLFVYAGISAQPILQTYEDGVYREYIKSVRLHVNGLALTQPITKLGSQNSLFLSFDDLDGQGTIYYYTVIHCDRYWRPTESISQFEYLRGYREGEIRDYDISSGTIQNYLHYYLTFPNEEVNWTVSGNYLLVVYERGWENDPILTRRFMVTEDIVSFNTSIRRANIVSKRNTHQEIDFGVQTEALNMRNPRAEFTCTIVQNGRWENRIEDIVPRTITGTYLDYNYSGKIIFPAGKEFRNMDISSTQFRSEDVLEIEEYVEGFSTILFPREPRDRLAYLWRRDLNGMFVPYNRDYMRKYIPPDSLASTLNLVQRYNYREQQLSMEYMEVIATLTMPERPGQDIYIVGGMTDWKMLPEYRLSYDERVGGYIGRMYLKQGYYNYGYAIEDEFGRPDFSVLEGDWYETENAYLLLGYFRPLGGEYDRLVGAVSFGTYF